MAQRLKCQASNAEDSGLIPGEGMVKNVPANAGSIPGSGRCPGGGHGSPLRYSCLENPRGQESLAGCTLRGHQESDMTERLTHARVCVCI